MKYSHELSLTDNLSASLKHTVESRRDWIFQYGFDILLLPPTTFINSKLLSLIIKYSGVPVIFKMNKMTWYDWHTDSTRQCAINLLIDGFDSHCFYGDRQSRDIVNLTELIYKPNTYYLLNTQEKHAVLNLSQTRHILSIGFDNISYDDMRSYLIDNNI